MTEVTTEAQAAKSFNAEAFAMNIAKAMETSGQALAAYLKPRENGELKDKPPNEIPLLFQRILSNCTLDWFRRQKTRRALFSNMSDFETSNEDGEFDLLEHFTIEADTRESESAEDSTRRAQIFHQIEEQIAALPGRQREAFLMRYWEEMDVAETAAAMGCSEGSVKTHCSRAVHALSKALKAKGISL